MDFELGTDGSGAENLIVKNGAMRNPNRNGIDVVDGFGNTKNDNNLFMNGSEIFNFTLKSVPSLINTVLTKNNMNIDDIDMFVFHQANKFILNHLRKKLNISEDKFYIYIEDCGNTVSSTIAIALKEAMNKNKITGNILLAGFGVGYSWGSCVIKINK
jgi:3-oxoacyl-[acyl-carrier-protein] synthase III